MLVILFGRAQ